VETLLVTLGMRVGRAAFKKGIDPPGSRYASALPSCIAPFHLPSPRMGSTRVAFVLLLLEERDPTGVVVALLVQWSPASHLEFVVPQAL
jgi:hypothetical protein